MPNPLLNNFNIINSDTDDEDKDFMQALYLIAPDVLAQIRHNQHAQTQLYLTCPELLIHPQGRTPWQVLYHRNNDHAFITIMGLNVQTFYLLLESRFQESWESQPILQVDANSHCQSWLQAQSLDVVGSLGLILHYLTSTIPETALQQIFALIPIAQVARSNYSSL
jgi:hypothetical protein